MTEVLKALQELEVYWKKIGHYNMKCKWAPGAPGHHDGAPNNSMHGTNYFGDEPAAIIENEGSVGPQNVVKFEVQVTVLLIVTYCIRIIFKSGRTESPHLVFGPPRSHIFSSSLQYYR